MTIDPSPLQGLESSFSYYITLPVLQELNLGYRYQYVSHSDYYNTCNNNIIVKINATN